MNDEHRGSLSPDQRLPLARADRQLSIAIRAKEGRSSNFVDVIKDKGVQARAWGLHQKTRARANDYMARGESKEAMRIGGSRG